MTMAAPPSPLHPIACAALLLSLFLLAPPVSTTLYMVMEYGTDGTVVLNQANFTIRTLSINVTLLGCDYGYYDHYLLYPPVRSAKTQITPFDCRACVCTDFSAERVEEFIIAAAPTG
jgi:hypothetical protein